MYSHIVNVTALEGKFNVGKKSGGHPHTNMAKAALNMMTLTGARDYARTGILMNSVDTVRRPPPSCNSFELLLLGYVCYDILSPFSCFLDLLRMSSFLLQLILSLLLPDDTLCYDMVGLGDGHGPGGRGGFLRHARDLHRSSARRRR